MLSLAAGVTRTMGGARFRSLFRRQARKEEVQRAALEKATTEAVEQLGNMKGLAMKLGQMMSYLSVLPEDGEEQLAALQDAVPPDGSRPRDRGHQRPARCRARGGLRDVRLRADRGGLGRPGAPRAPRGRPGRGGQAPVPGRRPGLRGRPRQHGRDDPVRVADDEGRRQRVPRDPLRQLPRRARLLRRAAQPAAARRPLPRAPVRRRARDDRRPVPAPGARDRVRRGPAVPGRGGEPEPGGPQPARRGDVPVRVRLHHERLLLRRPPPGQLPVPRRRPGVLPRLRDGHGHRGGGRRERHPPALRRRAGGRPGADRRRAAPDRLPPGRWTLRRGGVGRHCSR